MGIVYSEGVVKRKMSLERFAAVTSTNAAKILGLYPRKGVIAPGSDADIAIIDPSIKKTLAREDFHVSDYSPWEGWAIQGWPITTILRGRVVVENRRMVSDSRDGKLVARKISGEVLRRPAC
jgi:dihydropyrimidinase